jgi:ABC-type nitrate/sulfonate/bicarbonate transport system substrate-binding protein
MGRMISTRAIALLTAVASLSVTSVAPARAQSEDIRFVVDFLLQGQQSPFVLGRERGYYTAQKINFAAFDPGRGGADSITKVASGTHDVGFGDLSALIEFNAKNPGRELIAVLLIYDQEMADLAKRPSNLYKISMCSEMPMTSALFHCLSTDNLRHSLTPVAHHAPYTGRTAGVSHHVH